LAPGNPAGATESFGFDQKAEGIGNPGRASDLYAGARRRNISHNAIDMRLISEENEAAPGNPVSPADPLFGHDESVTDFDYDRVKPSFQF
jgi:hypothetical protein